MTAASVPAAIPGRPVREAALALAISSLGPSGNPGVEEIILNRAKKFASWLAGEADTQPE